MDNYRIVDDLGAEKVLLDLRKSKEETDRLIETCDSIIREYTDKKEQLEQKYQEKLNLVNHMLEGYFETVETKESKTQRTYKLPSAKLIKKNSIKKMKATDNLINIVPEQFIKTTLKLDWAEYKNELEITEMMDEETGELINVIINKKSKQIIQNEYVEIEETGEKFEFKYI